MVVFPKGADLSKLGIGLQAGEDGSIRLTAYHSDAPLNDANRELLESLHDGWQRADEDDAIDDDTA